MIFDWLWKRDKDKTPKQLPVVKIEGKKYYRDDRLEEFRAVDNPHDRIPFSVWGFKPNIVEMKKLDNVVG